MARVGTPELGPAGVPPVCDVEAPAAPDPVPDSVAGETGLVGCAEVLMPVWLAVVPVYGDRGPWPSVVLVVSAGEELGALVGEPEVAPASPVV